MARGEQRTRNGLTAYPRGQATSPTISSISTDEGSSAGGTSVTVTGTGFTSGLTFVKFDTSLATSVTVTNSTTLTCLTPSHAIGTVDVTVIRQHAEGSDTLAAAFTYAGAVIVSSVSPDWGYADKTTAITITGESFTNSSLAVTINSVSATSVTFVNSTTVTCTTPAGTVFGPVTVALTCSAGSDDLSSGYYYHPAPLTVARSATTNWDTRSGGSQSIQASTDIADANSDGAITTNNLGTMDAWDTDIEGSGKRGYQVTWSTGNHQGTEAIIKALGISGPADCWISVVRRQESGFHNAQGGAGGRKFFVLFRDSGGGNDARNTCEASGSSGTITRIKLMGGSYTGYDNNPSPGTDGEICRVNLYGSEGGTIPNSAPDIPFDIDSLAGTEVAMAYRIKSESAANAKNGVMEAWFNGRRCQQVTSACTSPNGFYEFQWGGPTWNAVTSESIEWFYDWVCWTEPM